MPSLLRAAATHVIADASPTAVTGEPKLAPLSALSRTRIELPIGATNASTTSVPDAASATPASAAWSRLLHVPKSLAGPGLVTRW